MLILAYEFSRQSKCWENRAEAVVRCGVRAVSFLVSIVLQGVGSAEGSSSSERPWLRRSSGGICATNFCGARAYLKRNQSGDLAEPGGLAQRARSRIPHRAGFL
ncbi:hypothetical protein NDU88_001112 [Pleurodeles waltl]|uniref:Uncharacterized protein n=1 Tax=Pleurodeles waltl TaxID=8319 RepID=A0AAV7SZ03_PLEWA|nr:hypothetical protein NDU88_001112 [Pleurodeles waltl]